MKAIVAVLCVAAFGIRTSGQAQVKNVPVVVTPDYYAQPRVLVLLALNNSGKDITGYTIIIRHKKPDGAVDENGRSESMEDMLGVLVTTEMAKDPAFPRAYGSKTAAIGFLLPNATASSSQAKRAT
jgi:hypothetical protein